MALNREAPTLIVGYVNTTRNNEHYQSLLPVHWQKTAVEKVESDENSNGPNCS